MGSRVGGCFSSAGGSLTLGDGRAGCEDGLGDGPPDVAAPPPPAAAARAPVGVSLGLSFGFLSSLSALVFARVQQA
jgi:hypothetical protein